MSKEQKASPRVFLLCFQWAGWWRQPAWWEWHPPAPPSPVGSCRWPECNQGSPGWAVVLLHWWGLRLDRWKQQMFPSALWLKARSMSQWRSTYWVWVDLPPRWHSSASDWRRSRQQRTPLAPAWHRSRQISSPLACCAPAGVPESACCCCRRRRGTPWYTGPVGGCRLSRSAWRGVGMNGSKKENSEWGQRGGGWRQAVRQLPASLLEEGKLQSCPLQHSESCDGDRAAGFAGEAALQPHFLPVWVDLTDVNWVKVPVGGGETWAVLRGWTGNRLSENFTAL